MADNTLIDGGLWLLRAAATGSSEEHGDPRLTSLRRFLGGAHPVVVPTSALGSPPADGDADVLEVEVTGSPKLQWDQSAGIWVFTHALKAPGVQRVIEERTVAAGGEDYIEFTWSAGAYRGLEIEMEMLPETDAVELSARFYIAGTLEDDAADYDWYTNAVSSGGNSPRASDSDSTMQFFGSAVAIGFAAGEGLRGRAWIDGQARRPSLNWKIVVVTDAGLVRSIQGGGTYRAGAGALTGIRLYASSGQLAEGSYAALKGRDA